MKQYIVGFAIIAAAFAAQFEHGLRIRFDTGFNIGTDFFYEIPRTVSSALKMSWTKTERTADTMPSLLMYCEPSCILCCLYDPETEFIGGIQIGIPLDQFTGYPFDWTIQGFRSWKPSTANSTYMIKELYFISEETLAKPLEERQKAAKADKVLQEDYVWPVNFHQKRLAVGTQVSGVLASGFTKQSCIPWMGTHYFYNMTTTLECKSETVGNWFALADGDDVVGAGLAVFGVLNKKAGQTYFFENPSLTSVKVIVKTRSDCFTALAGNPTVTTMHIYFIDKPWKLGCYYI